jgi:hypothetical protein
MSVAHSSERVNPGNRAVTKVPGGKVNADVQIAITNVSGGKVNTYVFDNFSGAIYADTDLGNSVLRGKMRYGRNEEVGINGEVEVATANEELTKEFKGQQKRGDSADIGQHKMGDFKFFCMVPNFSELLLQNLLMSSKFYSCNFAHLT